MPNDRERARAERMSKLRPKIAHDWEDMDKLDTPALHLKIVECQANLVESERERKTDHELALAKSHAAELDAPYKEAKTRLVTMMEYATLRLEERGAQ